MSGRGRDQVHHSKTEAPGCDSESDVRFVLQEIHADPDTSVNMKSRITRLLILMTMLQRPLYAVITKKDQGIERPLASVTRSGIYAVITKKDQGIERPLASVTRSGIYAVITKKDQGIERPLASVSLWNLCSDH
ncbi:hypothetical protein M8J75_010251 [Diaphorina citri]|nr:hypothetical protein M8J75_010251 [Diaphorina citri]